MKRKRSEDMKDGNQSTSKKWPSQRYKECLRKTPFSSVWFCMTYQLDLGLLTPASLFHQPHMFNWLHYSLCRLSGVTFPASVLPHGSPTSHDACYLNHKSSVSPGKGKQWRSRLIYEGIRLPWLPKEWYITRTLWHTYTHTSRYTIGQWHPLQNPSLSLIATQHTLIPCTHPSIPLPLCI